MFLKLSLPSLWIFKGRVWTREGQAHPKPESMSRGVIWWRLSKFSRNTVFKYCQTRRVLGSQGVQRAVTPKISLNTTFKSCQTRRVSSGKSGSAESGEVSAFNVSFQAPLGTKIQPQWQEVEEIYHQMRRILHNQMYIDGERLFHEDEIAVRDVLKYHPKCEQKIGPGIEYIKIQQIFTKRTRCFWVVRVDGTEIDFSYHKCLKEKAAKECPDLLEHYVFLYKFYKPRSARNPT